ncbi:hypothetical protein RJ639_010223 [Escallonia herrerae]|uniref:Uncharacterized protein n=1 Tax=Escallonia herrerae TaxID=1293975 RepID=A0AA88VRR0_9ASTE|nr:hypothetical protein RJ639_010223 [Escallonia herrerae]
MVCSVGILRDQRRALEQKEAMPANVDQTAPVIHAPVERPKTQTKQLQLVSLVSEIRSKTKEVRDQDFTNVA